MPAKRTKQAKSTEAASSARKPKSTRTTAKRAAAVPVGHDEIALRAYFIHLEGGGDACENWLRAERELLAA
jgi:hypothetical protein